MSVVKLESGPYTVFPTWERAYAVIMAMKFEDRKYHEVIFNQRQKLKFDIDAPLQTIAKYTVVDNYLQERGVEGDGCSVNGCGVEGDDGCSVNGCGNADTYDHIVTEITSAVAMAFHITYGYEPRITRYDSYSDGKTKLSSHLIIPEYSVSSATQATAFTSMVASLLTSMYLQFLDLGVNRKLQCFRMLGNHKGDGRVLCVVADNKIQPTPSTLPPTLPPLLTDFVESVVTSCGVPLPDIAIEKQVKPPEYSSYTIEQTIKIASRYTNHKFHRVSAGLFIFHRVKPDYCELCKRTHDRDNNVYFTLHKSNRYNVYFRCRKFSGTGDAASIHCGAFDLEGIGEGIGDVVGEGIGDVVGDVAGVVAGVGDVAGLVCRVGDDNDITKTLFLTLPNIHSYDEPSLRPFELCKTLVVHAMMKMGKTKALAQYIERNFTDRLTVNNIRILSFRQTFSGNIKEKFPDFTLYSEVAGNLVQPRIIIQIESLYRLVINNEQPDLLVLDECESIFEQFDSGLLRYFEDSFAKFQYLLRYTKHVVCMDANISDRTYRILQEFRGLDNTVYHHCTHKNATADNYYITSDRAKWLNSVYSSLHSDEKIAIQMSSLAEAKALEVSLRRKFPDLTIRLYSSETSSAVKKEHFTNVGVYWTECDVLIYTPTVSAGVSYELKHFSKCFAYFMDSSCPVETSIQMMGRIRDVADHTYVVYISASRKYLPSNIDSVRTAALNTRAQLFNVYDNSGLRIEYDGSGQARVHTTPYFSLWCENTLMRNLSRADFVRRFAAYIIATGAHVHDDSDLDEIFGEAATEDVVEWTTDRADIKTLQCTVIADAPEITSEEFEDITGKMQREDVTELMPQWRKFKLRRDYNWGGAIDPKFVSCYDNPKTRRQYKNWNRILCDTDPQAAVKLIQAEELAAHNHIMDTCELRDVNRRYVFNQHRYAIGLMQLSGYANLLDITYQHEVTIAEKLRNPLYWRVIYEAVAEFQISAPKRARANICTVDSEYVKILLKPINTILTIMYGVQIVEQEPQMYALRRRVAFSTREGAAVPTVQAFKIYFDE
tara:strand:+ start:13112 stop:16273 length:3162 start_codon:yes stop_codon:yes gene_type:complete